MKQGSGKIIVELEGVTPDQSQMKAIGNAIQAAVAQSLQLGEKDGLLIRPVKLNPGASELTLRLARVVAGGEM